MMVFGRKKKIEEEEKKKELPPLPTPKKFEEQYGEIDEPRSLFSKSSLKTWEVIEEEIPSRYITKIINRETGEEFEIESLQDLADFLNSRAK